MAMGSRSTSVSDKDDLSVAWDKVKTEVGGEYQTVLFKNRSPLSHGFPILRPRFYIVGVKGTSHDAHELQRIAEQTSRSISSECPAPPSYLRFLNIDNHHSNWDRLYCLSLGVCISRLSVALIVAVTVKLPFCESCLCPQIRPNGHEIMEAMECGCKLNPLSVCPKHPCHCKMCKSGDSDACKWRHAHLESLKKKLAEVSVKDEEGKLTYMQLLEMAKKDCGVSSPRERNLLNIMAFMHQPLTRSELVLEALTKLSLFYVRVLERMRIVLGSRSDRARSCLDRLQCCQDLSQTIGWCQQRVDGVCPTIARKSRLWVLSVGKELDAGDKMDLMGIPPDANFTGLTPAKVHCLLGNMMHVSDIGVMCGLAFGLRTELLR